MSLSKQMVQVLFQLFLIVKVRQSLPMEMAIKPYILTMSNIAQLAFAMQMELVSQKRMMKTTVCQA